jgi:hypothetical protein
MDQELKQYLEGMEERINANTDTRFGRIETNLTARFERFEATLLTAFQRPDRSTRGVSTLAMGFEERLASVEERVTELERKRAS